MDYPHEQIEELKEYCTKLSYFEEAGHPYFQLKGLRLPPGCSPETVDALFCPVDRGDGYPSRLFFPVQIATPYPRNWHVNVRLGEANWAAYSWKVAPAERTLADGLLELLKSLTRQQ
jgi:hypothetical protein